jgi:hypothetical protein
LALGVGGGIATAVGLKSSNPSGGSKTPESAPSNFQHYLNVKKDVKQTLIAFLNATIANFSVGFLQAQRLADHTKPPISVENAPGWSKILKIIELQNYGPINKVDDYEAFIAPKLNDIAKVLLNSVKAKGVRIEKINPKGPLPKKPTSKVPVKNMPPRNDEDRISELLKGDTLT